MGLSGDALAFVMGTVLSATLGSFAPKIGADMEDVPWSKGNCPICGSGMSCPTSIHLPCAWFTWTSWPSSRALNPYPISPGTALKIDRLFRSKMIFMKKADHTAWNFRGNSISDNHCLFSHLKCLKTIHNSLALWASGYRFILHYPLSIPMVVCSFFKC